MCEHLKICQLTGMCEKERKTGQECDDVVGGETDNSLSFFRNDSDDEYSGEGQSIENMHDLVENDKWVKAPSLEKLMDDALEKAGKELIEKWKKEGKFRDTTETNHAADENPIVAADVFVDPETNEDMSFESGSMTVFWRLVILDTRLIDIVTADPSIRKLGLNGGNTAAGCWIVFTSKKIAAGFANKLTKAGYIVDCHLCNKNGETNDGIIGKRPTKVEVSNWRPWNKTGNKSDDAYKANEFFYCITVDKKQINVYIVPESYWNENKKVFKGELNIDNILQGFTKENTYKFISPREELQTQAFLDKSGFRENLVFNAYINEVGL